MLRTRLCSGDLTQDYGLRHSDGSVHCGRRFGGVRLARRVENE